MSTFESVLTKGEEKVVEVMLSMDPLTLIQLGIVNSPYRRA